MSRRAVSLCAAGAIAALLALGAFLPNWLLFLVTMAASHGVVSLGILLIMRGGLVSFGQGLFFAIGGYGVALAVAQLGVTDAILLISRLLSYENRGGTLRTLTEHSLGRIQPEITSAACGSCLAQLGQGGTRRNEIRGRAGGRGTRHEWECPATADRAS